MERKKMAKLFEPFQLKGMTVKNRIMMSPMCQYSVAAEDGKPNDWHYVHYLSRAVGGVGLIMMEMTDVQPNGRITTRDLGIWSDDHIPAFARIVEGVHRYGARIGVQIAHAGRKAELPEEFTVVGPSAIPFGEGYRTPKALTVEEIKRLVEDFRRGARRAVAAGFDTVEIHGAHGYLLHQFMSPLSNKREDEYGEPTRLAVEVIRAVRAELPAGMPLLMRISGTEYDEGGYTIEDMVKWVKVFHEAGVDAFDVSSGGNGPTPAPNIGPGYQVHLAERIRRETGVPVITVGMMDDPKLAEEVLQKGKADLVAIGRGLLRNPYWANEAALALGLPHILPKQYNRAFPLEFQPQR